MIDSVGTTSYLYDEANRLKHFTDPFGNLVAYTYDKAGNRKTIGYPGSRTVTYGYDAAERMSTVLDWTSRTATYTYTRADQITRLVHGNGTTADYTYDAAGRLTSLINKQPNSTVISSHIHTLDPFGNITQADEILPLQPTLTPRIKRWTVDDANRVLTQSVAGDSFEHDTAGRLIRQIIGGATTNYSYNDLDLLTTLSVPGRSESYRYNGHGHRVERTVNGTATRYLVEPDDDLPDVLVELNSSNIATRFYVYGAEGLIAQTDTAGTFRSYHFSAAGNAIALSDSSGAVTDQYAYAPFGEISRASANATANPFTFMGQDGVVDDGFELLQVRARYLNRATNRFISLDPIGESLSRPGMNQPYVYADGNPLSGSDPTGQKMTFNFRKGWEAVTKIPSAAAKELKKQTTEIVKEVVVDPLKKFADCAVVVDAESKKTTSWAQNQMVGMVGSVACFGSLTSDALPSSIVTNTIKAEVHQGVDILSDAKIVNKATAQQAKEVIDFGIDAYSAFKGAKELKSAASVATNKVQTLAHPKMSKPYREALKKLSGREILDVIKDTFELGQNAKAVSKAPSSGDKK